MSAPRGCTQPWGSALGGVPGPGGGGGLCTWSWGCLLGFYLVPQGGCVCSMGVYLVTGGGVYLPPVNRILDTRL